MQATEAADQRCLWRHSAAPRLRGGLLGKHRVLRLVAHVDGYKSCSQDVSFGASGGRQGQGRVLVSFGGGGPGDVLSRTPEAARSRTSTVVLSVVVDVAAAEGGGVIVAVVVPGLSGVYLCRAFLHVPCEGGFAVARKPWWLHASSCPSFVVGRSVGPSAVDDVVLGASGASPGSPKTVYDTSLGGF